MTEPTVKDKILNLLSDSSQPLSGENIGKKLQITRAAVWKAVKQLQSDGYEIIAHKGCGYTLAEDSDLINWEEIKCALAEKGWQGEYLRTIDSTNLYLKRKMQEQTFPEVFAVVADEQTSGKGRMNRDFLSPARQGVYMSFLFSPSLPAGDVTLITAAAAVAAAKAVERTANIKTGIKWVNDLFYKGKKVCGILTEGFLNLETGTANSVILGVGINTGNVPNALKGIASSLREIKGGGTFRQSLILNLINEIDYALRQLKEDRESIVKMYRERLFMLGMPITVKTFAEHFPATAIDIDENCGLIVRKNSGETLTLNSGEVSLVL